MTSASAVGNDRRLIGALAVMVGALSTSCSKPTLNTVGQGEVMAARDENGAEVTLRIDSVEKDAKDAEGDIHLYAVSYRDPADSSWKPYCLPDRDGRALAIPLSGFWNQTRDHVQADDVVTFACTNSPLAKCVRWGYKPWKTVGGVSLRDHHLACVRMTRADYCGDGRPHTREGTMIELYDRIGIQKREAERGMVFEAAWGPHGAVYVNRTRYAQSLDELVAECPERLRGRTRLDAPGLDDQAVAARWREALLFNESRVSVEPP